MASSFNASFFILICLIFASVGLLLIVDAKTCIYGMGTCGQRVCCGGGVCDESCCMQKCNYEFAGLYPKGYCYSIGPQRVCACQYSCD